TCASLSTTYTHDWWNRPVGVGRNSPAGASSPSAAGAVSADRAVLVASSASLSPDATHAGTPAQARSRTPTGRDLDTMKRLDGWVTTYSSGWIQVMGGARM